MERIMEDRKTRVASPSSGIGYVSLTVSNVNASVQFYHAVVGLHVLKIADTSAVLGTSAEQPLLALTQTEEPSMGLSKERPGIDHLAILTPDRDSLARHMGRLLAKDYPIRMISDHGVNESIYVQDPDGIVLELTRDFPPEELAGRRPLGSRELALQLLEGSRRVQPADEVGSNTKVGHILLRVSELPRPERFYTREIGFDVSMRLPGAVFVSAGGYHHHLGFHIWESEGSPRPDRAAIGLRHFSIVDPGYNPPSSRKFSFLRDPSGNGIVRTPHANLRDEELLEMDKTIMEKGYFQ